MNIILLDHHELREDGTVIVTDGRKNHIRDILKAQPGDRLRIGMVNGPVGTADIVALTPDHIVLAVDLHLPPPPRAGIGLILALPRPIMLQRIFSQTATLGVNHLYLIKSNRVEKSFFQATLLEQSEYERHQRHGLEQAVDTVLPDVSIHRRFRPFMEDVLPALAATYASLLLAHPDAPKELVELHFGSPGEKILLAVGPEGGWVDYEVEQFQRAGFSIISAGPRIMRVDLAVPVLIGQLTLARSLQARNQKEKLNN